MGKPVNRVLFVDSEVMPSLPPETPISKIGRCLPQGIQERKKEIRAFMPRYGCINERKNQLHEVIRLSRNEHRIIGDVNRPLVIKVASISSARIQVYFIDNEDYFRRKQIARDADGKFFEDNGQRAIFFARGVLETVKKLRWAPDVVHCPGLDLASGASCTSRRPTTEIRYSAGSRIVTFPLQRDRRRDILSPSFKDNVLFGGIKPAEVPLPGDVALGINLAETAAMYSDGIIFEKSERKRLILNWSSSCEDRNIPTLPFNEESIASGRYVEEYDDSHQQLQ